jgi:hypothetical protein
MWLIVDLNGVQVAKERVFPGLQTILLEQPFPIDPAKPVAVRLRFPELPVEPPGSLQRVSVYAGTSRADYIVPEAQLALLSDLRKQLEQATRIVIDRRADLDAASKQWTALDAAIKAGTERTDAPRRLDEQMSHVKALDQTYREAVMKMDQDDRRFQTETQYFQEKDARANAARDNAARATP